MLEKVVREGFSELVFEQRHRRNCQEGSSGSEQQMQRPCGRHEHAELEHSGAVSVAEAEPVREKRGRTQRARSHWQTDCLGSRGRGGVGFYF